MAKFKKDWKYKISEVLEKCSGNELTIQYVWRWNCRHCGEVILEYDEEYSFQGMKEDFLEKYGERGDYAGVLDPEEEVVCIDPKQLYFRYQRYEVTEKKSCPLCDKLFW